MLYNKNQFRKTNDKKVLHKIGKHWVAVSVATLMALGAGAVSTTVHANADTNAANGVRVTSNANVSHRTLANRQSANAQSSNSNSVNNNAANVKNRANARLMVPRIHLTGASNQAAQDAQNQYNQNTSNLGVDEKASDIYKADGSTNRSNNEPKTSVNNTQVDFGWINSLLNNKSSQYRNDANNFLAKQAIKDAESGKWNGTDSSNHMVKKLLIMVVELIMPLVLH